ncbi:MAG: alpha/beta hydrolase [Clostridia bacterium]|nr:alpha/beta hydrolase [Clostridia bacterium]
MSKKRHYDILPDFRHYTWIHLPMNRFVLRLAAAFMPMIQPWHKLYRKELTRKMIKFNGFKAKLIQPASDDSPKAVMLYIHGGGFALKAAAYHKELAQHYAARTGCTVLFPDYSLTPGNRYPVQLDECISAYMWLSTQYPETKIIVGGDSAGGCIAAAMTLACKRDGLRIPDALMLVYPVLDARMQTESMKEYTDTPMWNSRCNRKMWEYYADSEQYEDPYVSPACADDLTFFPRTYVETTQYDCLHDEGIIFAQRLQEQGVAVEVNETKGTMHGYDIAQKSPYVKEQVERRIAFLASVIEGA